MRLRRCAETEGVDTHGLVLMNLERYLRKRDAPLAGRSYDGEALYEDAELDAVLAEAADALGDDRESLLRGFGWYLGTEGFPRLAPEFYERHGTLQSCLLAVESQIHDVVRDALPGAAPPRLRVTALGERGVVVAYTSPRKLCALLEGLVAGTAERYGTPVTMTQPQCAHRGDPWCSLVVEA